MSSQSDNTIIVQEEEKINEEKCPKWFHELDRYATIERVTHAVLSTE